MAQRIGIDLFGRTFTFETQAEEGEALKAKSLVEGEIQKIQSRMGGDRTGKEITILVLTALSLAGDCLELQKTHEAMCNEFKIRLEKLVRLSDAIVKPEP